MIDHKILACGLSRCQVKYAAFDIQKVLERRKPDFNETYHGFRSFSQLLEEAQARKLLTLEHDEKSGGYIIKLSRV